MKDKQIYFIVAIIAILLILSTSDTFKSLTKASFTSYSGNVPVQIGYDKQSSFWILTATVGWTKDTTILVKLPSGSSDKIGTETIKSQKDMELTLTPKGSYDTASLSRNDLVYKTSVWNCQSCFPGVVPSYQVEGANWITTTVYDVNFNGQSKTVKVGMSSPSDIDIGQRAFIKNLGIISNGANAPSGDYILIQNPESNQYEFYRLSDVQNAFGYWNLNIPWTGGSSWPEVWQFLKIKGKLPPKPVMTAKSYTFNPSVDGNIGTIQMNYDNTAQSSFISVYIPSSLADTIVLKIGASKAVIIDKTDIKVTSASTASFSVTVRNDGGDDYVTVKATTPYGMINPVTKFMTSGASEKFLMEFYAYEVTSDKTSLPISVTADGTDPYNGDSTTTVYASIKARVDVPMGIGTTTGNVATGTSINSKNIKWYETTTAYIMGIVLVSLIVVLYKRKTK